MLAPARPISRQVAMSGRRGRGRVPPPGGTQKSWPRRRGRPVPPVSCVHSGSLSMTRRPTILSLEHLESRYAPATLLSPTKISYQDADGDSVTVTFSKPILNAGNVNAIFTFDKGDAKSGNAAMQQ